MKPDPLHLYVWQDAQRVNHSGVLGFAIARSEEQAKSLIRMNASMAIPHWGKCSAHPINEIVAYAISAGDLPS